MVVDVGLFHGWQASESVCTLSRVFLSALFPGVRWGGVLGRASCAALVCLVLAMGAGHSFGAMDDLALSQLVYVVRFAVAGFDAGAPQKNAVRQGWFLGSVTQDPYMIGFLAVELAYKAATGEEVADADTGAQWYTKDNIEDEMISMLVYD